MANSAHFKLRQWLGFTLLALAYAMVFFHRTAPSVVASELMISFNISAAALGALSASYFYLYTLAQIPAGILSDTIGPRFTVGLAGLIGAIGCIGFSLSESFAAASWARLVIGLGMSTGFVAIMKYNTQWFPANRYGAMSGLTIVIGNLGGLLAATPMAWALNFLTWRELFVAIGGFGAVIATLVLLFVKNSPRDKAPPPVESAPQHHWLKELGWVLKNRRLWPLIAAQFGGSSPMFAFVGLWIVPLMNDWQNLSRSDAASYATTLLLGAAAGSLGAGVLSDWLGKRKTLIVLGCLIGCLSWLYFAIFPWQIGFVTYLVLFILGFSQGMVALVYALARESSPAHVSGMSLALVNTGLFLGVALGQTAFGEIMDQTWDGLIIDQVRIYQASDYKNGLLLYAAIGFGGLLASLFIKEPKTLSSH